MLILWKLPRSKLKLNQAAEDYSQGKTSDVDIIFWTHLYIRMIKNDVTYEFSFRVKIIDFIVEGELIRVIHYKSNATHDDIWTSNCIHDIYCIIFEIESADDCYQAETSDWHIDWKLKFNHVYYRHLKYHCNAYSSWYSTWNAGTWLIFDRKIAERNAE